MFRRSFGLFLATLTVAGVLSSQTIAADSAFSDAQRSELNAMMKQFILDNPQSLITSVEAYYNKQNDTKKAQEGRVDQMPAGLYDDKNSPVAGDKNASFAIVEFFDYNCGYCKQVTNDLNRVIKEEKNLKVIFKELPILSEMSEVASRHALAANMQGKYLEYHNALMAHQGPMDQAFLESTAKDLGLNITKWKKDADSQEVRDVLTKNVELARLLGVRGTPFFLIGKAKMPGAVGYTRMKEVIMKERDGVTAPTAPTPTSDATPSTGSDAAPDTGSADATTSGNVDPELQKAINDAKSETNEMLEDLKKQADEMRKAAEDALKKQEAAEAAAAKKAAATPAEKK